MEGKEAGEEVFFCGVMTGRKGASRGWKGYF